MLSWLSYPQVMVVKISKGRTTEFSKKGCNVKWKALFVLKLF